jgi:DNA end-binding protein Ku
VLVSPQELTMALTLVEMLEEPFDPKKYHDGYRQALLETIEAKANGQEVVATPEAPLPKTVDLMTALKASLEAAKKGKPAVAAVPSEAKEEPDEPQEVAVAF